MKIIITILVIALFVNIASSQKMMKSFAKEDIILFGELHNSRQLILGTEMMEADNQNELNDYLKNERKDLSCGTITTVSQDDIHKLEEGNIGKADFIICVDGNMANTYLLA